MQYISSPLKLISYYYFLFFGFSSLDKNYIYKSIDVFIDDASAAKILLSGALNKRIDFSLSY